MAGIQDRQSDRELPRGVDRKIIRTHDSVRLYLRGRTEGSEKTMSQELMDYMPENWEEISIGYGEQGEAHLKVTPDVKDRITAMTGSNVSQGDVLALFVLLGACRNGDLEAAEEITQIVPELVWDMVNGLPESILEVTPDE